VEIASVCAHGCFGRQHQQLAVAAASISAPLTSILQWMMIVLNMVVLFDWMWRTMYSILKCSN